MTLRFLPRLPILDRYIIREIIPPTGVGLLVFTFVLLMQQITILTGILISRGADLPTTLRLFFHLLPSIFAITIPMAFLLGVLLAFGRMASESEIVALRASGISPVQMLRPVLILSMVAASVTLYVMTVALPRANTAYRELFYTLVITKARSEIKPRVFTDDFLPGMVLYVSDVAADTGQWKNVFISDTRVPAKPKIILAQSGHLVSNEVEKTVMLHLDRGFVHTYDANNPRDYYQEYFKIGEFFLPFDQIFPKVPLMKGDREMDLGELWDHIQAKQAQGKPLEAAPFWVELHKKFSIPAACVVFGMLGLGLSLGNRKEARSAAFGLSIAVIAVYYVFLRLGEQAGDTGMLSPFLGMWGANLVLGVGAMALIALNQREAAFDPLSAAIFTSWIPSVRRRQRQVPSPVPAHPKVLVRVPRPAAGRFGPLPTILDRYIARQYAGFGVLILLAFWCLFFLFHFMDLIDDVHQNHIKGGVVVHYYAFYSPEIVYMVLPLAMLVATLTTFGVLSRHNEITAIKAGGISVYRTTTPIVFLGVAGSLLLFVMGEFLLPHTNKVANQDFNIIKGRPPQSASALERRWILGSDGRIYNYDYMSQGGVFPRQATAAGPTSQVALFGLSVFEIDSKVWNLSERLYASRATWYGAGYTLERGWRWTFRGATPRFRPFGEVRTREVEAPNYFRREDPPTDSMRFMELRSHIVSLEELGVDVARLKVQLHEKLAFPWVALIMTMIGLRYSFSVGRRGALYGIGFSIMIAITYMICLRMCEHMGNNALLPAVVAAWAPNVLFGAASLYLMLTLET